VQAWETPFEARRKALGTRVRAEPEFSGALVAGTVFAYRSPRLAHGCHPQGYVFLVCLPPDRSRVMSITAASYPARLSSRRHGPEHPASFE
jgi:hypothetical protein